MIKLKDNKEVTEEDYMSRQMSTMKQSTLSKLLEDVRMPMTRINFDFEGSGKDFSHCETEVAPPRNTLDQQ